MGLTTFAFAFADCGNEDLKGTNGLGDIDAQTAAIMKDITQRWCTKYNEPFEVDGDYTVQYFARMWFDLLQDSDSFLAVKQGESDPYIWTSGLGCGYDFQGVRYSYRNATSQEELMENVSGELYYIDEGELIGAIDRNLLMGGRVPQDYDASNPLQESSVIQTIYPALVPKNIVDRVKNCNRPGGPVEITEADAEEIMKLFKEEMENTWTEGWDDDQAGEVSFVAFFDGR